MRRVFVLAILGAVAAIDAQVPQQTVDVAPVSARFPATWYPPDNKASFTGTIPAGAPYMATLVTTAHYANPDGGTPIAVVSRSRQMRDSAGRLRSETPSAAGLHAPPNQHAITVDDPVAHCSFQWFEPLQSDLEPRATVTCMPRTVYRSPAPDMEAKYNAPATTEVRFGQKILIEPLGERTIGGVRALGQRNTRYSSADASQPIVNELWWSPELRETVLIRSAVGTDHEYTLKLDDIKKTEPPAELFYPPVSYKILGPHER